MEDIEDIEEEVPTNSPDVSQKYDRVVQKTT